MDDSKKNRTRRKIIDAALDVFISDGIRESSFEGIAEQAEVARRTIYNHFNDRDQLLCAIIDSRLEPAITDIRLIIKDSGSIAAAADFCLKFWMKDSRLILLMRKLQEEKITVFSRLHGEFLGGFKQLLCNLSEREKLRFDDPDINLKLIFFSLFPMLEYISAEEDFETEFRDIFKKTLASR